MEIYLKPAWFTDSDNAAVINFSNTHVSPGDSAIDKGIKLYYAVRDKIRYNPYAFTTDRSKFKASYMLSAMEGFCIQKAILLSAAARAAGIPARLRFVNVVNHLTTENLKRKMKSDLFVFHGCTEMFLEGRWVKSTPAFNLSLCEKFGIRPLDFDGRNDSLFHPFDRDGRKHMEYVHDYGDFEDLPFDLMVDEMIKFYPHLVERINRGEDIFSGNFEEEAVEENKKAL